MFKDLFHNAFRKTSQNQHALSVLGFSEDKEQRFVFTLRWGRFSDARLTSRAEEGLVVDAKSMVKLTSSCWFSDSAASSIHHEPDLAENTSLVV